MSSQKTVTAEKLLVVGAEKGCPTSFRGGPGTGAILEILCTFSPYAHPFSSGPFEMKYVIAPRRSRRMSSKSDQSDILTHLGQCLSGSQAFSEFLDLRKVKFARQDLLKPFAAGIYFYKFDHAR